jgi:hypothetical protein
VSAIHTGKYALRQAIEEYLRESGRSERLDDHAVLLLLEADPEVQLRISLHDELMTLSISIGDMVESEKSELLSAMLHENGLMPAQCPAFSYEQDGKLALAVSLIASDLNSYPMKAWIRDMFEFAQMIRQDYRRFFR